MKIKIVIDQMGREVEIPFSPKRIVSLVPSQTELLFDLGLSEEVVGITKFCIHPKDRFKLVEKIGGTKQFKFDKIDALKPDLIIGNKEENYREGIEILASKYPVWMSDIFNLEDALEMMLKIGDITNKAVNAQLLVDKIGSNLNSFSSEYLGRAAYFIWQDPLMVAGNNTFINEMLEVAGFDNVFKLLSRYPHVNEEMLIESAPEFILLSSEPYPFKDKHIKYFSELVPDAKVILVDGEIFSWYGSRLLNASDYFKQLHKDLLFTFN